MSPSKRSDRRTKRRAWAAPFVITAALAMPGCVVKDAPAPEQPAAQQQPQPTSQPPTVVSNPPAPTTPTTEPTAPTTEPTTPTTEKPIVLANPPPPKPLPTAPANGGTVDTRKDGTCWWHTNSKCPENATCNPPPPHQVKCPPAK